jgi:hypothetical protein
MSQASSEEFVLDTGPLLDYLVVSFQRSSPRDSQWVSDLVSPPMRREVLRAGLLDFIESSRGRLQTCPGVFAEIHHRIEAIEAAGRKNRDAPQGRRSSFWQHAVQHLTRMDVREVGALVKDLPQNTIGELGPVDATLITIVARAAGEYRRLVLLTNETRGPFRRACDRIAFELLQDRVQRFLEERGRA